MNTLLAILIAVAFMTGCAKSPVESDSFSKNLCPVKGVSIQKSADGLERTIKTERDWLGDKYSPIRFTCEAASLDRLLEFIACGPLKHFDNVTGRELLPEGTYRYYFQDKTWDDDAALLKDVMSVSGETFGLTLEVMHNQAKTVLVVKQKQKVPPN